jgi:hypothetical protein
MLMMVVTNIISMFKIFNVFALALILNSCVTSVAPQASSSPAPSEKVLRGELSVTAEFCGEFLDIKCSDGSYKPQDSLVIFQKEGEDGLVFNYDKKISEVAGKVCDFVIKGQEIKSYSNCQ